MKLTGIFPLFLLACLLWPCGALAEPVQTRFGLLDVVEGADRYSNRLSLNGHLIDGVEGHFHFVRVVDWGERGDVAVLAFWSGGASCCHSYQIVHLTGRGPSVTPIFGEHGFEPSNFTAGPAAVSFRLERSYPASVDHLEVRYGGDDVSVVTVWEDDSDVAKAGAGQDVLRWDGQPAVTIFEDPGERVRFRQIMTNHNLDILRISVMVGGKTETSDGFLLGSGCWSHRCNTHFGFFAIEITTGRPFAAYTYNCKRHSFGAPEDALPDALRTKIEDHRRRLRSGTQSIWNCAN